MNVDITLRHGPSDDNIREYAMKKIRKVSRLANKAIGCHVVLDWENNEQIAEINLSVSGKQIFVRESTDDMYRSVDGAVDKLVTRLKKFKTTRYSHN
ncbi:MAG: ribosome hibernation-promoting factor, HPF/YfiA family [Fidelibacterota bacterium]